jgi:hypothetical protein
MCFRLINKPINRIMMNKFFESPNNINNWVVNNKVKPINTTPGDVNLLVLGNTLTKP